VTGEVFAVAHVGFPGRGQIRFIKKLSVQPLFKLTIVAYQTLFLVLLLEETPCFVDYAASHHVIL
jgi:hypothetical protein